LLADRKDGDGERDEIVIDGTDRIVYQTERVAISDCAWLLKPLAPYESREVEEAENSKRAACCPNPTRGRAKEGIRKCQPGTR
jgi:hypothetical protein